MMALAVGSTAQLALGLIGAPAGAPGGDYLGCLEAQGRPRGAANETSGCWELDCLPLA